MPEKVEGTIALDGLIEGRLGDNETAARLREWTRFVGRLGLKFDLSVSGGQFSLLPDNAPASAAELGDAPERAIADALKQMLDALPDAVRPQTFSTLRSAEYRKGEEVQAIYGITPDGAVDVQRRVVDAVTVAPPEPIDLRTRIRMGVTGLLIALAMLGVLSLFVDLRGLFGQAIDEIRPMTAQELTIDTTAYRGLLTLEDDLRVEKRVAHVTLVRGPEFPVDMAALDAVVKSADSTRRRLALEALAAGHVRVELFDDEGAFYAHADLRVGALFRNEKIELAIQLHPRKRTSRIVLGL